MELAVSLQLYQASTALLVGFAAGLFYDLLKLLRRRVRSRAVTMVADVFLWLVLALILFVQTMAVGRGEVRIFMLAANCAGAILYFLSLSEVTLGLLDRFVDLVLRFFHFLLTPVRKLWGRGKKVSEKFKKDFKKLAKRCTIRVNRWKSAKRQTAHSQSGVDSHEEKKGKYIYEAGRVGDDRVRGNRADRPAGPDRDRSRRTGRTARGRKRAGARQRRL